MGDVSGSRFFVLLFSELWLGPDIIHSSLPLSFALDPNPGTLPFCKGQKPEGTHPSETVVSGICSIPLSYNYSLGLCLTFSSSGRHCNLPLISYLTPTLPMVPKTEDTLLPSQLLPGLIICWLLAICPEVSALHLGQITILEFQVSPNILQSCLKLDNCFTMTFNYFWCSKVHFEALF